MAKNFPSTFALASPSTSTVSFVDQSDWTPDAREFPGDIRRLVDSAGELLFFVNVLNDPFEVDLDFIIKKNVVVSAWNPFTKDTKPDIEYLGPHPGYPSSIRSFPTLVRVQLFPHDQELDESFLKDSLYFQNGDEPPIGGYIFSMVGFNREGKNVMESYYSYSEAEAAKRCWRTTACDNWTIQTVATAGLYPPSIVFKQIDTGVLVKFDDPQAFIEAALSPHPDIVHAHFAKLDDPHMYVFLLRLKIKDTYYLSVERHASSGVWNVKFLSTTIRLKYAGSHPTYVYGAKSGAVVVEHAPLRGSTEFKVTIHLYHFESQKWYRHDGVSKDTQKRGFSKALLCQTTAAFPSSNSGSLDGASISSNDLDTA